MVNSKLHLKVHPSLLEASTEDLHVTCYIMIGVVTSREHGNYSKDICWTTPKNKGLTKRLNMIM